MDILLELTWKAGPLILLWPANTEFVMIMDSGEDRVAAFVQEHRRRLRVRLLPSFWLQRNPHSFFSS